MYINPSIFKSYDIRGIYPQDLNEPIVFRIIQSYIKLFTPKKVVLGRDVRESGEKLFESCLKAFTQAGIDVIDIGIVSTDQYYYAVGTLPVDGGVTVSASHNPREWNGLNFCKRGAEPISSESGLLEIKNEALKNNWTTLGSKKKGKLEKHDVSYDFLKAAISMIDISKIKPTKLVANANFGVDVVLLNEAVKEFKLPLKVIPLNAKPDGAFPKGPPNPLLPESRKEFLDLVVKKSADLGVSWDADGDRCFFADEKGNFIEGYFITAILAKEILQKHPNSKILIDPRLTWATTEEIERSGGKVVVCKPGMTIIAARMKKDNIVFGGEMSSHFYFKENFYRDNGLIPLLIILEMLGKYNTTLSKLASPYTSKYFTPGEINFETENKDEIIKTLQNKYEKGKQEFIDGLSVEFPDWRFNIRKSNTEPLLRLNLETRSKKLMEEKRDELIDQIKSLS
ncbi:MAG: phosphomannomutase/phosphoglucomutase [Candidatus Levybacteria bacterium]|nr:phosphomannomutase/phosphoglucomutase [Candidatus Levybacteria bacterium]